MIVAYLSVLSNLALISTDFRINNVLKLDNFIKAGVYAVKLGSHDGTLHTEYSGATLVGIPKKSKEYETIISSTTVTLDELYFG